MAHGRKEISGWESDSKAGRYENGKADALMWTTALTQPGTETSREASCCQRDEDTVGASPTEARPTDSAKTGLVCGNPKLDTEVVWS